MPSREKSIEDKQKAAPVKKAAPAKKAEKVAETDIAEAPATPGKKLVQKSPLQEKLKKFLKEVDPTYPDKVVEMIQRKVTGESADDTAEIVFVTFSPNGVADLEKVDIAYNKEVIKNVLFHYHTAPENVKAGGKVEMLEIVPPSDPEAPHVLGYYEM